MAQTLTVLNPMARIDQHIMDDADLAGPFLFCALFGTFLLLVRQTNNPTHTTTQTNQPPSPVRQTLVRLRLRPRSPRSLQPALRLQHDVPTPQLRRSCRNSIPQRRE